MYAGLNCKKLFSFYVSQDSFQRLVLASREMGGLYGGQKSLIFFIKFKYHVRLINTVDTS